jgi:alkylation response protein AidB-like acyl-CoA dehydrogenase
VFADAEPRDDRSLRIYEGASEVQKMIIAEALDPP